MTDQKGSGAPQEDDARLNGTAASTNDKAAGKTGASGKASASSTKKTSSTAKSKAGTKTKSTTASKSASTTKTEKSVSADSEPTATAAGQTQKKASASAKSGSTAKKTPAKKTASGTKAKTDDVSSGEKKAVATKSTAKKGTQAKTAAKAPDNEAVIENTVPTEEPPKSAAKKTPSRSRSTRKPSSSAKSSAAVKAVEPVQVASEFSSIEEELVATLPPFYAPQRVRSAISESPVEAPAETSVEEKPKVAEADVKPVAEPVAEQPAKPSRPERPVAEKAPEVPVETVEIMDKADVPEEAASVLAEPVPAFKGRSRRGRARRSQPAVPLDEAAAQSVIEEIKTDDSQLAGKTEKSGKQSGGRSRGGKQQTKESARDAAPKDIEEQEQSAKKGRRKMFVSVTPGEQIEVVVAEEGQVLEYYVEMLHQAKTKGNIYKATIHNVDPNLQAAFVNYGAVKNGFLQIDEVHPEYFNTPHEAGKGRKYPPIQKVLKNGQELLVQVVKEPSGTKGAFLTTYLSMPGRFLVLTPGREQIGVSRKVDQDDERSRLREMLEGLSPGPGLGVIVRTASEGASKTNLQRDLHYLKRLWKDVRKRGTEEKAPCLIYQEMDLTARATRDYLTDDVNELWIDDESTYHSLTELVEILFPRKKNLVRLHKDSDLGLFERFNLQKQIEQIHSREVVLPSGGRLVIDPTEALTAIDINSGRSGGKTNFEDMAYRTNMEAAKMIPLQLRLRDIGGQIVADFIEMRDKNHWREVEKQLRTGMKADRARYDVGKIGPFGMLEIVRQRLGSSAISVSTEVCPHCKGTGVRRNMEWRSQQALRSIQKELRALQGQDQAVYSYATDPDLALFLLNNKRERILEMEKNSGIRLEITISSGDA